ncbi:MAG: helix-turn-helix domain-containing protein [Flavobacteriaceae bacterium]|nr:helix-turn-helix domain-containing protein [Flavobacteriaceae bacterium]
MKKYTSLGELLLEYREIDNISQADFAASLNVDIRTVQRWENNQTLIKPEKEEEIVKETLLPYQLVRNLNATIPIPTYYDFRIRKYSLTSLDNNLPEASWLIENIQDRTKRIVTIMDESDIEMILRDIQLHNYTPNPINKRLIREVIKLLPELNFIILDDNDYYAGHSLIFPIKESVYQKLKNKEISEEDIQISDLVDYKIQEKPVFYNYDMTADSNDNVFYLAHHYFNFFLALQETDYTYCSFSIRHDSIKLNKQLGLKMVWEDIEAQKKRGLDTPPRFYVGDFKEYLSDAN